MLNRLLNIFKSESEKTQLLVLVVIAFLIQVLIMGFGDASITTLLQLALAWFIGYIFYTYINKTSDTSQLKFAKGFFIILVLFSIIRYLFF
jgi:hypothetical protein